MQIFSFKGKSRTESLIRGICYLIFASLVYIFSISFIQPELMHHVQHVGFYFNRQFLNSYVFNPGGITNLIALYITQYFYSLPVASLGISILLILQVLLFRQVLKKISSSPLIIFILSMIPSLLLLLLLHDYCFQYAIIIGILIITGCLWLVVRLKNNIMILPLIVILGIAIFHIADSGLFTLFNFSSAILLFSRKNRKRTFVELPILILFWYLLPVLFSHFIYNLPQDDRYIRFLYPVPEMILYKPVKLFHFTIWSLPVLVMLAILFEHTFGTKWQNKKWSPKLLIKIMAITLVIMMTGEYFLVKHTSNASDKLMNRIDYNIYHGNYEQAIRECIKSSEYGHNDFINLNYNLACMGLGQLSDLFFSYPQLLGEQAVFPDIKYHLKDVKHLINIIGDFYYHLGYILEAHHWAYEAQAMYPYSPQVLKRLLLTNLISRDYSVAKMYLSILLSSPVEKKWAKKYKAYLADTTLIEKDKEIVLKRRQMPLNIVSYIDINERCKQLLQKDSTNLLAFQVMMLHNMMSKHLDKVSLTYNEYGKPFKQHISGAIAEACMLYISMTKDHDMTGYNISKEVQNRFIQFFKILNKYKYNIKQARSELHMLYSNTYLYYLYYYYPLSKHNNEKKTH